MKKRLVIRLLVMLAVLLVLTSCGNQQTNTPVTLEQLLASPSKYNGKTVTVEAFYFHGWETIVLSETIKPSGYAPGHLVPEGKLIWVNGGIPKDIYDKLYVQQQMGPEERIGKLRIKGKFEYGGKYGHVGGFDAQLTPLETELLSWSPPQ